MQLGDRFRWARERKRLSQGQAAAYAETGQGYISDIEHDKRWPSTWTLLISLAKKYEVSADYLLGLTQDHRPASKQALSEAAVDAVNLIDSLPPERRAAAVSVLRSILEFAEVGVPLPSSGETGENALPEPIDARGGGVTNSRYAELGPQQILNGQRKDELLALLKKMVPPDVYERIRLLVESGELVEGGQPLTDAEIDGLLQSFGNKPIQDSLELFNNEDLGNGG